MTRVTVIHLTRPEPRAGNTELADAGAHGWHVRDPPDDGQPHPRGQPCPTCSHDADGPDPLKAPARR